MMKKSKDLLFVGGVHGDEKIGPETLTKLENLHPNKFEWIKGNPKALEANKRYIDKDLNRVFPGKKDSNYYEEQRAWRLAKKVKNYDYVIDLHSAIPNTGIFIIISNPTLQNLLLAGLFDVKRIVLWPSHDPKIVSLNAYSDCGLEIECGPRADTNLQKELIKILDKFLINRDETTLYEIIDNLKNKEYYFVYDKLTQYNGKKRITSFEEVTVNGETFYPLLEDQYDKFKCYKAKKLKNIPAIFHDYLTNLKNTL